MTDREPLLHLARRIAATICMAGLVASLDAAAVEVFRCDLDGGVMYTDTPCKGGLRLQIEPGAANPAALKRLEQTRESLNEGADQRLASMERAAQRKAEMALLAPQVGGAEGRTADSATNADYAYGPVWYPPLVPVRPRKPRHT